MVEKKPSDFKLLVQVALEAHKPLLFAEIMRHVNFFITNHGQESKGYHP